MDNMFKLSNLASCEDIPYFTTVLSDVEQAVDKNLLDDTVRGYELCNLRSKNNIIW